jgi:hypothetical protein
MRIFVPLAALLCAALIVAGCGGGGSSAGSNPTAPDEGAGTTEAGGVGTVPKATAPNAPAGSEVLACGGDAQLRTVGGDCDTADRIMRHWDKHRSCAVSGDASRGSCALGAYRCQSVKTDLGVAVSCARPGTDIAFVVKE